MSGQPVALMPPPEGYIDWLGEQRLSHNLRIAFPAMQGFSPRNLKYMRAFAQAWPDTEFVQAVLAQLPWCGKKLLQRLAGSLIKEFGKGFDTTNLRHMRVFYLAFPICDALRRELSWTQYRNLSYSTLELEGAIDE